MERDFLVLEEARRVRNKQFFNMYRKLRKIARVSKTLMRGGLWRK